MASSGEANVEGSTSNRERPIMKAAIRLLMKATLLESFETAVILDITKKVFANRNPSQCLVAKPQ
jgi:hypothetical protein